jgi:antitoxin VapB
MKTTPVFINNRSQAVRLPAEVRLPDSVKTVTIRVRGSERVIAPAGQTWDYFFQQGPKVSEDFLEDLGAQIDREREAL